MNDRAHTQFPFPQHLMQSKITMQQRQSRERKKVYESTLGDYLFPLQIRTSQCMWTTFYSRSPFPISFFSSLIVTMDFKAERHKTTFSNIQCQTPKNWRRIQSAKSKMASKKAGRETKV